jgi:hypothetical protein
VLPAWPNVGWLVGMGLIAAKTRVGSMADGGQFLRHNRPQRPEDRIAVGVNHRSASGSAREDHGAGYRQTLGGAAVALLGGTMPASSSSSTAICVSALKCAALSVEHMRRPGAHLFRTKSAPSMFWIFCGRLSMRSTGGSSERHARNF